MSLVNANVGGPSAGNGTALKRKLAIKGLLMNFQPDILFLQEFSWPIKYHDFIPEQYQYVGNREAGIMFDRNKVIIDQFDTTGMGILQTFGEIINLKELPIERPLMSRMWMEVITIRAWPFVKVLCVSWHGPYNRMTEMNRITEFKKLLKYVSYIGFRKNLPIIIGGDFNISFEKVSEIVQSPLEIYKYSPLRREQGKIIDFYIGSKVLPLIKMTVIDWKNVENGQDGPMIFDHDPVFAELNIPVPFWTYHILNGLVFTFDYFLFPNVYVARDFWLTLRPTLFLHSRTLFSVLPTM